MGNKNVKKNYIFSVINSLSYFIIYIALIPYLSRVLNPEGIGAYSFSDSLADYFVVFASLGFSTYAQRRIAECRDNDQQKSVIFWEIFFCRLMMVALSMVTYLILIFCGVFGRYTTLILLLGTNIVSVAFDIKYFFYGHEEFGKVSIIDLVIKIIGTSGIFIFVKQQNDVWIYILILTLITAITNLTMWLFLKKKLVKVKFSELKPLKHLKGSFVLFLPSFAGMMSVVLDKSLIGLIVHSDAENGFYEQANKIIKASMLVITCLGSILLSRNTHEINHDNTNQVKENNYSAIHFLWLIGIPLTCGIIFTASNLVPWFLGSDFNESILLLQVLSVLTIIVSLYNLIAHQYLLPYKKDKQYVLAIFFGTAVNLTMNIPLIYCLGALGAAVATIIAELSVTVCMLCLVAKELSLGRIFKTMVKPLLASLVMSAVICPLSFYLTPSIWHTLIMIGCGVITYGLVILILRDSLVMTFLQELKLKFLHKPKVNGTPKVSSENDNSVMAETQDFHIEMNESE